MPSQYSHIKRYQNFFGIDLKSNDLAFPEQFASGVDNVQFTFTGTLEKRAGYQATAEEGGKYGLFTYNRVDENGIEQPEVLGCSETIQRLSTTTMAVTYSGSAQICEFSLLYDTGTSVFRCVIQEGTTEVLNYSVGLGRDEFAPITIAALQTAINALTGFSATVTGDSLVPAAFLQLQPVVSIVGAPVSLTARYWQDLNVAPQTGKTGPLDGSESRKNDITFENVTSVQLQNCIYFSNGYDPVLKYDGQNVYRAGLPPASDGSNGTYTITATGTAGAGRVYIWRGQFVQVDANGNVIEGNTTYSPEYAFADPGTNPATVTVSNIQAGSGFNTNCALITGTATGTAIPVSSGHTMKAGDTAYLWDTVTGDYVTRKVVSVGATTVTVDSSVGYTNSTTNNQNVISNNLRIKILRNQNTGVSPTLWFRVVEIPNNSFAATSTYTDNTADANLFTQFLELSTDRSPPVKGKYLSAYQNLMITAGDPSNPNQVSVSDLENPEYFPLVFNQFTVTNLQGDMITGIAPASESFIVFQSRAIHAITGDVPTQSFRVDVITQDIGCVAHATIKDVRGKLCFLSPVGPRIMQGASIPAGLGTAQDNPLNSRIDPLFNVRGQDSDEVLRLKRAVALNDRRGERYLIFIPAESVQSGTRYSNSSSKTLVYDYTRDAWVIWSNLDMTGGVTTDNDDREILFIERRDSDPTGAVSVARYLYRFNTTSTQYDYQDHDEPISMVYKSPWEFVGNVAVLKNFQRIKVYSAEGIDGGFVLEIETEKDFTADAPISTCSINFESDGYGQGQYSLDPWGDPTGPGFKHKLSNGRATSLRVIFKNSQPQKNVAVTGYELEINAPYAPGFKS